METIIKIKALGIANELEMNLDTIKDGLERHAIEYADELQKILKYSINRNCRSFFVAVGGNIYKAIIDKDYCSRNYKINAFNYDTFKDVYELITDFKVLSGGNVAKMMRYMLEAIEACGNDAEKAQVQKTAEPVAETVEAFDPYSTNNAGYYAVSWIKSERPGYKTKLLNEAYFPTEEMAGQFAALLKGAGYKGVEIVNAEELSEDEEEMPF